MEGHKSQGDDEMDAYEIQDEDKVSDDVDLSGFARYQAQLDFYEQLQRLSNIPNQEEQEMNSENRQIIPRISSDGRSKTEKMILLLILILLIVFISVTNNEDNTSIAEIDNDASEKKTYIECDFSKIEPSIKQIQSILNEAQSQHLEKKKKCQLEYIVYCEQGVANIKKCHQLADCIVRNS